MTLPAFRQDVQTVIRRRVPGATRARTRCTFGFHRRWVRRWECETDMPKPGPLPQTSQTLATVASLKSVFVAHPNPGANLGSVSGGPPPGQTGHPGDTVAGRRAGYPAAVQVLEVLDAAAIRRWSSGALEAMRAHQSEIDALNVFPVPDGDTGTNMALTLLAAHDGLRDSDAASAAAALSALAEAAVLGAQGNSGVILSAVLRGLAEPTAGAEHVDGTLLARGLDLGAEHAWASVGDPVDGTILSACRAAAEAAAGQADLAATVRAAVDSARVAVERSTSQLAVLAEAGVVDAGAQGLLLVLDALEQVVTGAGSRLPSAAVRPIAGRDRMPQTVRESGSAEFDFEVQYLLDTADGSVDALREALGDLGDSVVVVGTGTGTWNVHAHVNDVGAAIEAGMAVGRPRQISVARFSAQDDLGSGAAIVAVAPGDGLSHLFEREGVHVVDTSTPSPDDVLAAIRDSGRDEVVLLPNGERIADVAEQAARIARETGTRVAVVPTRSPVQGLAAVAVHDGTRRFDDDVVAMAEAAAATRFAEVTVALEESLTSLGICQAGDVLGFIDGEVVEIGHGVLSVVLSLTDRLLGVGAELLTVLVGAEAPNGIGDLVARHVRDRAPLTEVTVYPGGQPTYPVIIGVE